MPTLSEQMDTVNRPDEWKIEQGMAAHKLPVLDQSGRDTFHIYPPELKRPTKDEEATASVGDRNKLFAREKEGWVGYVEWENYPEKKAQANKILSSQTFDPCSDFMFDPIPGESKFPRVEVTATIQCSGTRRIEQINLYGGQGDEVPQAPWAEGAIGTARYGGISLRKLIKDCGGLQEPAKHLEFYGADTYIKDLEAMNYVVSVPWTKVKASEVILAWEMNGEQLPKIHGYPMRLVVLGYIGARSVKWLYRVKAIENPTLAPVQSREYL
ncbi:Molybdopterin binding oxidoreductase [Penicillium ucsense]|uniref:Molybdopterin binding oxidoreductase n=1 Tax=Penicillium ucsense TaxID=2839758 RepID=A0A8J8VWI1_9EURO|nr:Molybdopterin binding oxidoreductase [Penicillium ucsense]KAF7735311.1 Molybdopterin binding oxidoreductase [Penicillium ucsense]